MDVDDRTQLAAVWLIGGPGPEATWPRVLRGRYAKDRGEWYFPKGTSKTAIRAAASSGGDGVSGVEVAARSAPTRLAVSTPTRGASASSSFSAPTTGALGSHVESTTLESGTHDTGPGDDEPVSARRAAVEKAVQGWTDQLIDRSARNNLLFFRDQRAGTLDLTAAPRDVVFDVLAGRGRTLDRFVPPGEGQREERLTEAARRARTIHKKAREWFEERGIDTLYIAIGLATWTNPRGAAVPAAPVLLAPATLTPRGAAHNAFTLEVAGDLEVNPTLLNTFAKEFDVVCDPEELLARPGMDGSIDTQIELEAAYAWLSEKAARVPGFAITSKIVLGNFSYAKLPMVKDLETSVAALATHPLVAALAGDPDAQQATRDRRVEVDLSLPDHTPPADEFLVLDADSSQSRAINKVLAGQDLVIKGPPGTGKSQTISNLVATLVARGKTVLFVAEKRAAIDAVLERLDRVGLGDLVLDLHGGASSKRRIAQSLAEALMANASITEPRLGQEHRRLDARRSELNDWTSALHVSRKPWGVSLYEASERLIGLGSDAATDVRLRGTRVRDLTSDVIGSTRECLREYVGMGGLRASSTSPWSGAQVTTAEEAERAQELVDSLALGALEPILDRLEQATASAGARLPAVVADWDGRLTLWEATARLDGIVEAALFDEDLPELLECLAPLGRGFWARIGAAIGDSDYRTACKRVKVVFRDGQKLTKARLFEALVTAHEVRTEWGELGADQVPASPEDLESIRAGLASLQTELAELSELLDDDVTAASRAGLFDRLRELRADVATLGTLPELHRLRTTLDAVGLTELIEEITTWDADIPGALDTFDYCVTASIFDEIQLSDVKASGFDGARHSDTVAEYQRADVRHIATTAERVRRLAAERAHRVADEAPEQAARVRREAAKKTRHQPIRELFAAAPEVMTAIKPCWVMSPLVVSQMLPNDRPYFDVVIFDEASQVRPAEAIPAIARGRQLVVAGDEKQLPPTRFFAGTVLESEDEEEGTLSAASTDFESILDSLLFLVDWEMLSWHYRSADERLIAFSNAHLYGKAMLTFPGVSGPECLSHVRVDWSPSSSGSDGSTAEVERVVELILDHAEARPDRSLGVIAMGIKHADRVDAALRNALADRPDLEHFFSEEGEERFFVKNLERVQGDERDAIILTVGYGRGERGQMVYRFGPLTEEGGERRLNVAVTRARRRMTVVSSFGSMDMDPEKTRRGTDLLRRYLAYAEGNGARLAQDVAEAVDLNPFELDVRDALEAAGIPLICQYGVSGYRLDFAAKHPDEPGRMVLAIEADGASYHSSHTARDRDRLRQEQLERLGWTFHRIWSQDWFRHRSREIDRAVGAYRDAVSRIDEPAANEAVDDVAQAAPDLRSRPERGPRPRIRMYRQIDEYGDGELEAVVRWIESDTLLRSRDEVLAETMRELGFDRRGKKIVGRISAAIDASRRQA